MKRVRRAIRLLFSRDYILITGDFPKSMDIEHNASAEMLNQTMAQSFLACNTAFKCECAVDEAKTILNQQL